MILTPKLNNVCSVLLLFLVSDYVLADSLQSEVIQKSLVSYIESNANELVRMHDILVDDRKDNTQTDELDLQILFHEFLISDLSNKKQKKKFSALCISCLLYTSDAADE